MKKYEPKIINKSKLSNNGNNVINNLSKSVVKTNDMNINSSNSISNKQTYKISNTKGDYLNKEITPIIKNSNIVTSIPKRQSNKGNDYIDLIGKLNNMEINNQNLKSTHIIGKVRENNEDQYYHYQVASKKADDPVIFLNNTKEIKEYKNPYSQDDQDVMKEVFLNAINSNKMSLGTKIMMDNERYHAEEAINCQIYVTWQSITVKPTIDCFRVGSKSKCICGHDFPEHEKIVTSKKFSSKCMNCPCKMFAFIPQLPDEVGEYWLPNRKGFKYVDWKGKCKCKHPWDSHDISKKLKCRDCNCSTFYSAFCCVVCNRFWHEHETVYELKSERISINKPVDYAYLPLSEAPEISNAVYSNIDKTKPKKIGF